MRDGSYREGLALAHVTNTLQYGVRSIRTVKHVCGVRVTTAITGILITRIRRAITEPLEIVVRKVMVVTLKYE